LHATARLSLVQFQKSQFQRDSESAAAWQILLECATDDEKMSRSSEVVGGWLTYMVPPTLGDLPFFTFFY
jgi:hypothetical protein